MTQLTLAYLRQLIDEVVSAGPVPSSRTITIDGVTFDLSADRSWTTSGGISDGDKGDITVSSSGTVWTIDTGLDPAKLADGSVSATEFQYINSLSSNAQTQIDGKQATLVSGTNIKTVFGGSLLGSGDAGIVPKAYGGTAEDNSTGGTANTFWARPNGATGAASYRAIVAADIPTLNQNTTGSAATLTTSRKINGVAFNGSADINVVESLNAYLALGGGFLANPIAGNILNVTISASMTHQALRLIPVWLPKGATITGVAFFQATQGNYTASNYNGVGLYSYSGGTLTLEASSSDDGNIWKGTSNTWQTKDFDTPFVADADIYFIGLLYARSAQTTAPQLGAFGSPINAAVVSPDFSDSAKLLGTISSQTSLPATQAMSGVTNLGTSYAAFLY